MDPAFPRAARETFIFGENYEAYWTCELLLEMCEKHQPLRCSSIQGKEE